MEGSRGDAGILEGRIVPGDDLPVPVVAAEAHRRLGAPAGSVPSGVIGRPCGGKMDHPDVHGTGSADGNIRVGAALRLAISGAANADRLEGVKDVTARELASRIEVSGLESRVAHRKLRQPLLHAAAAARPQ